MTSSVPVCVDPASTPIDAAINALKFVFADVPGCPPLAGVSQTVHFVGGEGPEWDPMMARNSEECEEPFLWVRMATRYRTRQFPDADLLVSCDGLEVIVLELGVGYCVSIEAEVDWTVSAQEAETGRDTAWRLDRALCHMKKTLKNQHLAVEPIIPAGPLGGGIVWTTTVYVGLIED